MSFEATVEAGIFQPGDIVTIKYCNCPNDRYVVIRPVDTIFPLQVTIIDNGVQINNAREGCNQVEIACCSRVDLSEFNWTILREPVE